MEQKRPCHGTELKYVRFPFMLYTFPFSRLCLHDSISTGLLLPCTPICSDLTHPLGHNSNGGMAGTKSLSQSTNKLQTCALSSPLWPPLSACRALSRPAVSDDDDNNTLPEYLLGVKHPARHFIFILMLKSPNYPMIEVQFGHMRKLRFKHVKGLEEGWLKMNLGSELRSLSPKALRYFKQRILSQNLMTRRLCSANE